jgi:GDP-mannose 6-dehydrogenase
MSRSVSIFGLGYVGAVTAACLAHKGHKILGVDTNASKVEALEAGKSPILEPKMEEMIAESNRACRLHATTDSKRAIAETEISFISVGTPSQRNGKLDLGGIEHVCREIGEALKKKNAYHWVVLRSTILPGTTESVAIPVLEKASGKKVGPDFAVCFVPEFLREGTAVSDFFEPPFTIIGAAAGCDAGPVRELFDWAKSSIFQTTPTTAEMVKYVCNAFHALKVGFVNEIGTICKELNVDTQAVTEIFTSDTQLNVSTAYLKPGFAFGGSCLPKDLRALTYRAKELDLKLPLLESLLPSNNEHIERAVESVLRTGKKKVGVLGLSFKSGTDDLRESPLVHLVKRLLGEGCNIKIWDQNVALGRLIGSNRQFITDVIPHVGSLMHESAREVILSSEIVLLGTKAIDKDILAATLRPDQILIDLVHLDKKGRLSNHELYEGICW